MWVYECVWALSRGCCWSRSRGGGGGGGVAAAVSPLGARSTGCHLRSLRHTWKSHGHVKWKCSSPLAHFPAAISHFPATGTGIGSQLVSVSSACAACCTDMCIRNVCLTDCTAPKQPEIQDSILLNELNCLLKMLGKFLQKKNIYARCTCLKRGQRGQGGRLVQ